MQFVLVLETGKRKLRHAAKYGEMGAGHLSQHKSECHVMQEPTKYNCKVAVVHGSGDQEICFLTKTAP